MVCKDYIYCHIFQKSWTYQWQCLECLGNSNTHYLVSPFLRETQLSIFVEAASVATKRGRRPECLLHATRDRTIRRSTKTTRGSMERWARTCCTTTTTKCSRSTSTTSTSLTTSSTTHQALTPSALPTPHIEQPTSNFFWGNKKPLSEVPDVTNNCNNFCCGEK